MRKLFTLIFAIALIFTFTGMALAWSPPSGGTGDIDGGNVVVECDGDYRSRPLGSAGGMSLGIAGSEFTGYAGWVWFGEAEINGTTTNSGFADSEADISGPRPNRSFGSSSEAGALSTTHMDGYGFGFAGFVGDFNGYAFEMTMDHSGIELGQWANSNGETSACAFQMGGGGYNGWILGGGLGAADADVSLNIYGGTYAYSQRLRHSFPGGLTSGLYSGAGASTGVEFTGDVDRCLLAGGDVNGGYMVTGSINLTANQNLPCVGYASANASGQYHGTGGLNSGFYGSTEGYVGTQITTYNGGTTITSAAGINVSSIAHAVP